jgi:hypothetical protein
MEQGTTCALWAAMSTSTCSAIVQAISSVLAQALAAETKKRSRQVLPWRDAVRGTMGDGCCKIMLASDLKLRAYGVKVVRHDVAVAKQHPDVKVIVSNRYGYYTDDLYSSWVNSSNVGGSWLEMVITDQPSCESGKMNQDSYVLPSGGGYNCFCPSYALGNPYVINGCIQGT